MFGADLDYLQVIFGTPIGGDLAYLGLLVLVWPGTIQHYMFLVSTSWDDLAASSFESLIYTHSHLKQAC
jgi:hypothetical protein